MGAHLGGNCYDADNEPPNSVQTDADADAADAGHESEVEEIEEVETPMQPQFDANVIDYMKQDEKFLKLQNQIIYLKMRALYVHRDDNGIFVEQANACEEEIKAALREKFGDSAEMHIKQLETTWTNLIQKTDQQKKDEQGLRAISRQFFEYFVMPKETSMTRNRFDFVYGEICGGIAELDEDMDLQENIWLLLQRAGNVADEMDWRMLMSLDGRGKVGKFQEALRDYMDTTMREVSREEMHVKVEENCEELQLNVLPSFIRKPAKDSNTLTLTGQVSNGMAQSEADLAALMSRIAKNQETLDFDMENAPQVAGDGLRVTFEDKKAA